MLPPPFISPIYTHMDFLVRFLYSRTFLGFIASRTITAKLYQSQPQTINQLFHQAHQVWLKHHLSLKNKTILEIGPGTSLTNTINFLGLGAKKVYLLDKYPRLNSQKPLKLSPAEITFLTTHYPDISATVLTNRQTLHRKFVNFHSGHLKHFRYKVDIIYSTSVLEHVTHPDQFINTMYSHLKPGGFMHHTIDLRDHYDFSRPFLFYRYHPLIWRFLLNKPGRSFTNRFRYHQFIDSFTHNGFNITWQKKTQTPLPPHQQLHSHFRAMPKSSLQTTSLHICLRKPKS